MMPLTQASASIYSYKDSVGPSQLDSLKKLFQNELYTLDALIKTCTDRTIPIIPQLSQHIILAGGKRIRPLLTLASARAFQPKLVDKVIHLAAAVEFIHTATLLHDDVVDESALRRGKPTAHIIWGNQASILVGDFLFTQAFQLMLKAESLPVLSTLAQASAQIAEGEIRQSEYGYSLNLTQKQALQIIGSKTAELFAAACEVGAIASTEDKKAIQALRAYGYNLGMLFQITDDILDYCAKSQQMGKSTGDDFQEGKVTLPILLIQPALTLSEQDFLDQAFNTPSKPETFEKLLKLIEKHEGFTKARKIADTYAKQAVQSLSLVPMASITPYLKNLVSYCLNRLA